MNLGENVKNAVKVVMQTYENIDKLIKYCFSIAEKESNYVPVTQRFLRYKSDSDWNGWLIQDFFLLFQKKHDEMLDNKWRNGPIYMMEINLHGDFDDVEPIVFVAKFEYKDISSWKHSCSPADWGIFQEPFLDKNAKFSNAGDVKYIELPDSGNYWGATKISYKKIPLVSITADNVKDQVFGTFDEL